MKATIFDDDNLIISNVVKVNALADVQGAAPFEDWHAPGKKYVINDGVRVPEPETVPPLNKDAAELALKGAVIEYENYWIDKNTEEELTLSRTLWENPLITDATIDKFPKAAALGNWKKLLYGMPTDAPASQGTYYARKNLIEAGEMPSLDFTNFDPVNYGYHDIVEERTAYLETAAGS